MAEFVFNVSDFNGSGVIKPGTEVFNELVLEKGKWGFGEHTPNRKSVKVNDKVLFYLTGKDNQVFLGGAKIKTLPSKNNPQNEWFSERFPLVFELKDAFQFEIPRNRKAFESLEWIPTQGGCSRISESDYLKITENIITGFSQNTEEEMEFALEKYLEEFIESNWDKINFGEDLTLYTDTDGNSGRQYLAGDIGYIDLLSLDKKGNFVILELKKGKKDDEVVGQMMRYLSWVEENLAGDKKVRGIIVVRERNKKLEYALRQVQEKVKVMLYKVNFKLEEY